MKSHINFFILIILAGLASIAFAQEAVAASTDVNTVGVPSFPYVAEITGDSVYIRSGPGTQYYVCGKLKKGSRVKVVSCFKGVWSRIVPPAGTFSWISKQYVRIDPSNRALGIVIGNAVRVRAGSQDGNPLHSRTTQLKLDRGDKVKLLGEEKTDYYKIAPPEGAYLWVSTKYTRPLGPVGEVPPIVEPKPEIKVVVPTDISLEANKLKEYYALEKQIEAERAKPIVQQNYTRIEKALVEIASNKKAGKAARYSEFAIKQIKRFELAFEVEKAVRLQDAQLQQIKEQIDKARTIKLAEVQKLGRFAVVGQFQTSNIYGAEPGPTHHRVIDDSGNMLCYTLPSGPALKMDLSKFVGLRVGLLGTIESHPQTGQALVRFSEIVQLR